MNEVYEVIDGSFKGMWGLMKGPFIDGLFWLKTGKNTRILVSKEQIKLCQ